MSSKTISPPETGKTRRPEIVLIRGLPGSGKTTLAKTMAGYVHLEADMFLEVDGKYVYDPSKVRQAHEWCLKTAKSNLGAGKSVVVSNTFVKTWEMQRYVDLGFPFRIIETKGRWPSVHGVPEAVIEGYKRTWEPIPAAWKSNLSGGSNIRTPVQNS